MFGALFDVPIWRILAGLVSGKDHSYLGGGFKYVLFSPYLVKIPYEQNVRIHIFSDSSIHRKVESDRNAISRHRSYVSNIETT